MDGKHHIMFYYRFMTGNNLDLSVGVYYTVNNSSTWLTRFDIYPSTDSSTSYETIDTTSSITLTATVNGTVLYTSTLV